MTPFGPQPNKAAALTTSGPKGRSGHKAALPKSTRLTPSGRREVIITRCNGIQNLTGCSKDEIGH
jgi:hypothetical protein